MLYHHTPVDLSPLLDSTFVMQNPFPFFHHLRERHPLCWDEQANQGIVTSYEACTTILQSSHFGRPTDLDLESDVPQNVLAPFRQTLGMLSHMLVLHDPPVHTQLRQRFGRPFLHSNVETLRPYAEKLADRLFDPLVERKQIDVLHDFAYPFVGNNIVKILGLPQEDAQRLTTWAYDIEQLLVERSPSLEQTTQWLSELEELTAYLWQCGLQQQDGFFRQIMWAWQEQQLDRADVLSNMVFLLMASIAVTAQLIGRAFSLLLCHPDQLQLVQGNPSLLQSAIEEVLRFDSPIVHTQRVAKADFEWHGQQIRAGQKMLVCLAAANRDPAQFHHPDLLECRREKHQHLGFGYGRHACLGAYLAQTLAEIALHKLVRCLSHARIGEIASEPFTMSRYFSAFPLFP